MPEAWREVNVALIQHNSRQAQLVVEMLGSIRKPSYKTFLSESLSSGRQLLYTHHIDLVLLDADLPDSHGLDAFGILHTVPPVPKPIVALIGDDDMQLRRDVIREGASDYLIKGQFDDDMLSRVLYRVLLSWEAGWRLYPTRGNFANLIRKSPMGMIVTDLEGALCFANPAGTSMLGRSFHEVVGQQLGLEVPEGASVEIPIRDTDGESGAGEAFATETTWENNPARLIMVQNITQRKLAEEELRFQSQVMKTMADGFMVLRARDGAIIFTNPKFDEMFGYGPDELAGKHVSVLNASREREPEETAREILAVLAEQGEWRGEIHNVKKDGTIFWTHASVSTFEHRDHGTVWVSIQADITERKRAEDERARLAAIVESSDDAIISKTLDGTIVSWNRGAERMYGYSAEEVLGRPGGFFTPPDRPHEVPDMLRRAGQGEIVDHFDTQRVRKDGTLIDVSLTAAPVRDSSGNIVGASSIAHDITSRKETEKAIQESEARFRSLLDSTPDGVVIVDSNSRIQLINAQTERMFGYRRAELLDQPMEILLPEWGAGGRAHLRPGPIASPSARAMGTGLDTIGRRKDGSEFPVDISLSPLETEEGLLVISTIRDITERKRAEDERVRLAAIVESSDDAIIGVTLDGIVHSWNRGAERIYGYSAQEMAGRSVALLAPPDCPDEVPRLLRRVGEGQTISYYDTQRVRKDGTLFDISLTVSPVRDISGRIIGGAAIARDITERKRAEEEHARLATIVESSDDAIIGMTVDGTVLSWNKGAERIYGYSAGEMVGRSRALLVPPGCHDDVPELMRRLEHGEMIQYHATKRMRKDGALIDIVATVSPVRDSSGRVVMAASIARDITERNEAEKALRESEERFRSLVQSASSAIIIADERGDIISWNQSAQNIFGYTEEEVLGRPITRLMPERYREDHKSGLERVRTSGQGALLGRTVELFGLRKDGSEFPVEISLSSWQSADKLFFSGILDDITERKRLEEDVYRQMYDNAPDMMVSVDPDTSRIVQCNQTTATKLGYSKEELIGRTILEVYHPDSLARATEAFRSFAERGQAGDVELQVMGSDGSAIDVSLSVAALKDEQGNILHSDLIWRDITERKRAEERVIQLNRSNTDLERFAYVASHDLQEPLRMISGFSQMLREKYQDQLDADANEYIWYLVDAAGRMRDLINDLLALSRVQTQGKPLEMVNCEEALGWSLSNLRNTIEEARAVVTHDALPEVMGDATQLMQLFQNLLVNAIKFRKPEPPRIHISAEMSDEETILSVKDNGIGIEPEFHQRIFEIFQRLHTRDRYPGTGIGLAICQRIIERHGGRIWVESEPGLGSTFYISFPRI